MGWLALVIMMAAAFVALVLLRLPRLVWSMVGAALMLGATGYALQCRPDLPAQLAIPAGETLATDPAITDIRGQMFGRFGAEGAYLTAADALSRNGSSRYEVQTILGGIRNSPKSVQLWTALGDAIARHDHGQLSPAAALAFSHAAQLDPRHPGPPFFRGMALARAGDVDGAEASWRRALSLTAPDAVYRPAIVERLALIDNLRQMLDR
ncbi:hypothetical protein JAO74_15410 [Sphingomonas sp. BT553]|uniref:Cytochrome c biogenesis factor n=2 Tax=Sphingomonas mollis TaxID=2795726 RepID=A0ABS0XT20_9SPHN|nr:hypothetical protein [Sphingomonas sp. BT553]MBJ6123181.1 hypothetical protein [Sphingomonas sp. BT553]